MQAMELARNLAAQFARVPGVRAVGVGGSLASGAGDPDSDVDLYVFADPLPTPQQRAAVMAATGGSLRADLDLSYWDAGDEWIHPSGIEVDIVLWTPAWIAARLRSVLVEHRAEIGYTTCFWHTMRGLVPLADDGWLAALQAFADRPYPEELAHNIVARNHPLLREIIPAYANQLAKAVGRGDAVSVNHRLGALLASYFDIVFAANRVPHPGEKRLIAQAQRLCASLPERFSDDLESVLAADSPQVLARVEALLDHLDAWLAAA